VTAQVVGFDGTDRDVKAKLLERAAERFGDAVVARAYQQGEVQVAVDRLVHGQILAEEEQRAMTESAKIVRDTNLLMAKNFLTSMEVIEKVMTQSPDERNRVFAALEFQKIFAQMNKMAPKKGDGDREAQEAKDAVRERIGRFVDELESGGSVAPGAVDSGDTGAAEDET
jgi:hypothetical protein